MKPASQLRDYAYYEALAARPEVQAFLDVIARAEGTDKAKNPYGTTYGYKSFSDFSKHPNIAVTAGGYTSTAAGRYQALSKTWNEVAKAVGIKDFTPKSQDIFAIARIDQRNALADVLEGKFQSAVGKLNKEWASLPGSPYGQPTRSMKSLEQAYNASLQNYAMPTMSVAAFADLPKNSFGELGGILNVSNTPSGFPNLADLTETGTQVSYDPGKVESVRGTYGEQMVNRLPVPEQSPIQPSVASAGILDRPVMNRPAFQALQQSDPVKAATVAPSSGLLSGQIFEPFGTSQSQNTMMPAPQDQSPQRSSAESIGRNETTAMPIDPFVDPIGAEMAAFQQQDISMPPVPAQPQQQQPAQSLPDQMQTGGYSVTPSQPSASDPMRSAHEAAISQYGERFSGSPVNAYSSPFADKGIPGADRGFYSVGSDGSRAVTNQYGTTTFTDRNGNVGISRDGQQQSLGGSFGLGGGGLLSGIAGGLGSMANGLLSGNNAGTGARAVNSGGYSPGTQLSQAQVDQALKDNVSLDLSWNKDGTYTVTDNSNHRSSFLGTALPGIAEHFGAIGKLGGPVGRMAGQVQQFGQMAQHPGQMAGRAIGTAIGGPVAGLLGGLLGKALETGQSPLGGLLGGILGGQQQGQAPQAPERSAPDTPGAPGGGAFGPGGLFGDPAQGMFGGLFGA